MDVQSTVTVPREAANAFAFRLGGPDEDREFMLTFIEQSTRRKEEKRPAWDEAQDNYTVTMHGDRARLLVPWTTIAQMGERFKGARMGAYRRSRLKDPETHQNIETLTAQAIGLLLGSRDYIQCVPVGADDYEKARILARILMAVLESPGWKRTHYQVIKNAFIYGTAIVELAWETRSRPQMTQVPQFDPMGNFIGYALVPMETVYRDAPLFRETDIYDFYPDPGGTRIHHDMVGVAKRFETTRYCIEELARAGTYPNAGAVRMVLNKIVGSTKRKGDDIGGAMRDDKTQREQASAFDNAVGFEYWGRVPYRRADGASNVVMTLIEDEVVRSHINPFIDGNIPFKEIVVNPVAGDFYGLAPTEVNRFLQDSADSLLMAMTDAANKAARPSHVVGSAFGGDIEEIRRGEEIIMARNADAVKPLEINLNALQYAGIQYVQRKAMMREACGANAQQLLSNEGGDRTATAASELVRLTSQRVDMMVNLMESDDYPWIGRTLHSRMRQFLPQDGGSALFRGETMKFSVDDIDFDADVRFVGSRHNMSQFQVLAQYREALNVLGAAPALVMNHPDLLVRYLRDGLKILDAERVVGEARRQFQIQQAMMMMASGDAKTGAGGSAPATGELMMGTESQGAEQGGVALG